MPVEFLTDEQAASYGRFAEVPSRPELERFKTLHLLARADPVDDTYRRTANRQLTIQESLRGCCPHGGVRVRKADFTGTRLAIQKANQAGEKRMVQLRLMRANYQASCTKPRRGDAGAPCIPS